MTCVVTQADQVMEAGAKKELAWLKLYGRDRFPFDRHHRETLNYEKSSFVDHSRNLDRYLRMARYLIPKKGSLLRPILRHPDLQPHNIFVSKDYKVVGLIDWQHASALPLFLHAGVPEYWKHTSDSPAVMAKP